MINQGEILTLDDNKTYTVAFSTEIDSRNYVCLIEQEDYSNIMFCEYVSGDLEEVVDPETTDKLLKIFTQYKDEQ